MRGQGRVFRPKRTGSRIPAEKQGESEVWWLDYSIHGERHRESSGTKSKREAFAILRERIGKRSDGTLTGRPERVTLTDLKAALERRYLLKGKKSWKRAGQAFEHLVAFFGANAKAIGITKARVGDYQEARLKAGAARNSIRYETGVLSAAFGAAVDTDLLPAKPKFPQLGEGSKRSGFFDTADFAALVAGLPRDVADVVRFARMTGWRRGECTGLLWSQVNWNDDDYPGEHEEPVPGPHASICLGEEQTKGKDARVFPLEGAPELRDLLLARWRARDGLHVFHRHGKPVGDFRKVWERACKLAGVPGRLFHDLRRTAARDFRQAGVSEGEIMALCGWKTRDMFDRYNIIDQTDLGRAVARRFEPNGKTTARNEETAESTK